MSANQIFLYVKIVYHIKISNLQSVTSNYVQIMTKWFSQQYFVTIARHIAIKILFLN